MEPRERGRGEGKEEGRRERRIMAELLTTPWMAKEDFLCQRAGSGTAAAALQRAARSHLEACAGQKLQPHHTGSREQSWLKHPFTVTRGKLNAAEGMVGGRYIEPGNDG